MRKPATSRITASVEYVAAGRKAEAREFDVV
jgi:hypothetical protein